MVIGSSTQPYGFNPNIGSRATTRLARPVKSFASDSGAKKKAQLLRDGAKLHERGDPGANQTGVTIAKTLAAMYSATATRISVVSYDPPQIQVTENAGIGAGGDIAYLMTKDRHALATGLERTVADSLAQRQAIGAQGQENMGKNYPNNSTSNYNRRGFATTGPNPGRLVSTYA
ncbi:hypothetical protein HOC01_03485 [archaeon]|jgi:hypothetical protein|nr:hypothetical protein [archaeon]MBT6698526.1 hypothetical protein [archaeon]